MAQDDNEQIIIIKKIKKGGHGGHHGGSWKVAYADFVTAMMAFFLMMWLLNSTSSEQKESLAHYFREYSILSDQEFVNKPSKRPQEGGDILDNDGSKEITGIENSIDEVVKDIKEEEESKVGKEREDMLKQMKEQSKEDKANSSTKVVTVDKEFSGNSEMANKIKSEIEAKLADIKDQIIVEPFKNFVRIEVIDKAGNPIFDIGSVEPTEEARKILKVIADSIKTLDVMLTIEGHTDARQYPSQNYTNWELSTGRASTFRIILGEEGVSSKRLISVSGLADTMPRIKEDPLSPFNRRVSILLYPKGQINKTKVEQK